MAELRLIVRIANKDLNGKSKIPKALMEIKGVSHRIAKIIAKMFEKETGIKWDSKMGELPEDKDKKLEEIVLNPEKFKVPLWNLNRQKEYDTGEDKHLIMADLDFDERNIHQRMSKIKSYRGLRRGWGLTVRGQKTKSTHRGKGPAVGVQKKDAKK
ncbi:MAG: 30S ribosomal protein S13 [Candidatus Diapherotrites archaeon CG10_big_fil_rev_8_21_14_0_10_31_34]|nr:MAG: 30S ribosomal protein S13 [Candidatus Diapherotrites archaeon CG10_big_fil_rev_8_21_14_0_10_31_34]